MNIPNLPSDSLYKFLSFFGLATIILSIFFRISSLKDINNKIDNLNLEAEVFNTERKFLIRDLEKTIEKLKTYTDFQKNGNK